MYEIFLERGSGAGEGVPDPSGSGARGVVPDPSGSGAPGGVPVPNFWDSLLLISVTLFKCLVLL